MKYRTTLIAVGFAIILVRFLGFSDAVRGTLYILGGLAVMALAYFSKGTVVPTVTPAAAEAPVEPTITQQ